MQIVLLKTQQQKRIYQTKRIKNHLEAKTKAQSSSGSEVNSENK